MVLISDLCFDSLGVSEETAEVRRVEAEQVAVHGEFLDLAVFGDYDVDGGFGAGEGRESECNDGGAAVVSADSKPLVNRVGSVFVVDWGGRRMDEIGDEGFLKAW